MKKIKSLLFCMILGLATTQNLSAQDQYLREPTIHEPNAASLGKYGDIPVSYHTGVPNISIPIHTVTEGELSLPISLSYHSAGIKVDEMASWVGLGWTLNAGGMISRTVNGAPDEGKTKSQALTNYNGHGWYRDYGMPDVISDPLGQCGNANYNSHTGCDFNDCSFAHLDAGNGKVDTQPDLFTYNFNGYSGKFIFDESRNVISIPKNDLVITPYHRNDPYGDGEFYKWKVVTPDGTQYFFGESDATENMYNGAPSTANYVTSTWYLYKVVSVNGNYWIDFDYEQESYAYATRMSQAYYKNNVGTKSGDVNAPTSLRTTRVLGVRLKSITTSTGLTTVTFNESSTARIDLNATDFQNVNTQAKALSDIDVNHNGLCKTFELNTGYFTSTVGLNSDAADHKRLKLNSVTEKSCSGSLSIPAYTFTYNTTTNLPGRHSLGKDHWGLYNGQDTQTSLIPNSTVSGVTFNGGSNRNPSETKMKAWILTEISYPTGGSSKFTYQAHRDASNNIIGGLRVQKIESLDSDNSVLTSLTYTYSSPQYFSGSETYGYNMNNNPESTLWGNPNLGVQFIASPLSAMATTQGYHIAYGKVTETQVDGSYTNYHYNTQLPITANFYYPFPPAVYQMGSGELTRTEQYDSLDNLVAYTHNYFDTDDDISTVSALQITTSFCQECSNNFIDPGFGPCHSQKFTYTLKNPYSYNIARVRVSSTESYKDGVTTTTNYTYSNNHNFRLSASTTQSDGSVTTKYYDYAKDQTSGAVYTEMKTRNMIAVPILERSNQGNKLLSSVRRNFEVISGDILQTSVDVLPDGFNAINYSYQYDEDLNLIEVQRQNGNPSAYVWKDERNSLAKFINAESTEVFYTSFEESGVINPGNAVTGSRYHSGSSYTIPLSERPSGSDLKFTFWYYEDGEWHFQEEATYGTYVITKVGASRLDEIRVYPADAQCTSYILGEGGNPVSINDANNFIKSFEYDDLGRMINSKDQDGNIISIIKYNFK